MEEQTRTYGGCERRTVGFMAHGRLLDWCSYFKEVALGFEFGDASEITRKWVSPMRIFIGGNPSESNHDKVEQTVNEINELATDGFSIEIVNDSNLSNCYVFFGSASDFIEKSEKFNE